jgi:diguanylate cyclase (GGDEF)-like protein
MSGEGAPSRYEVRDEASELPHLAQLRRGFGTLRFEPELEQQFRAYYWSAYRRGIRIGLFCGALIFALFAFRDIHALTPEVWHRTLLIRFGVMVPALLAAMPMTYRGELPSRSALLIWLAIYLVVGGLAGAILVSQAYGQQIPYEGLILLIIFAYFLGGLRLYRAAACCVSVSFFYIAISYWQGMPGETVALRFNYLLVTNIIGIIGGYASEHLLRRVFLTERIAEFRATRDPLTLIPNRRAGTDHLVKVWRHAAREEVPLTVLMIDIDWFKSFNDTYGHIAGDECLVEVAQTLERHLRRPLDIVARLGGEEFLGVVYHAAERGAAQVCEELRRAIYALNIDHAGAPGTGRLTVSIGAASMVPTISLPAHHPMDLADRALYRAKAAGRNRFEIYDPSID